MSITKHNWQIKKNIEFYQKMFPVYCLGNNLYYNISLYKAGLLSLTKTKSSLEIK